MMLLRFSFFWLIASKLISLLEKFNSVYRFNRSLFIVGLFEQNRRSRWVRWIMNKLFRNNQLLLDVSAWGILEIFVVWLIEWRGARGGQSNYEEGTFSSIGSVRWKFWKKNIPEFSADFSYFKFLRPGWKYLKISRKVQNWKTFWSSESQVYTLFLIKFLSLPTYNFN